MIDIYLLLDVWIATVSKWMRISSPVEFLWLSDPLFGHDLSTTLYAAAFSDFGLLVYANFFLPQPMILIVSIVRGIQLFRDSR